MWIRLDRQQPTGWRFFFISSMIELYLDVTASVPTFKIGCNLKTTTNRFGYKTGNNIESEQWYFLTITYKDVILKLYLDGSLVTDTSSATYNPLGGKISHFTLGNPSGLNATIDDFRYYNKEKNERFIHNLWRM